MAVADRGFASMDGTKQREIASKGGTVAHQKGRAHVWTKEEAKAAGKKGARVRHEKAQLRKLQSEQAKDARTKPVE